MSLLSRRATMMTHGSTPPPPPSGYVDLKYLQSSGHQYIDTGIASMPPFISEIEFSILKSEKAAICGSYWGNAKQMYAPYTNSEKIRVQLYDKKLSDSTNIEIGVFHTTVIRCIDGDSAFLLDDIEIGTSSEHIDGSSVTMYLFANNDTTEATGIYAAGSIKITRAVFRDENETVTRTFYPKLRTSDNKPGMYDTVSESFYTNIGTGEFGYEKMDGTVVAPI